MPRSEPAASRPQASADGCAVDMQARTLVDGPTPPLEAHMTEMVFPDHANHLGTLFGGQALAWMDKAAFVAASRYARRTVVTARSDRIDFHTAVPTGALVQLVARVVATGRTSMQVDVEMHCEDLLRGDCVLATRGRFTMVALDDQGRPAPVPALA